MSIVRSGISKLRKSLMTTASSRPFSIGSQRTVVSFCFDDFPRSALICGGEILRKVGARGTYYAAPGLMGSANSLGEQFRREDLDELLADGHELGSHTFRHLSCRSATRTEFLADVSRGRAALQEMTGHSAANFAYPYGHVSMGVKGVIGGRMDSCRGIYDGANGPVSDLNLLRANSLYGDTDSLPNVMALLARTPNEGRWLIFYTHDVREEPSPFGCTPTLLEETVAHVLRAGFTIAPVAAVIARAGAGGSEDQESVGVLAGESTPTGREDLASR